MFNNILYPFEEDRKSDDKEVKDLMEANWNSKITQNIFGGIDYYNFGLYGAKPNLYRNVFYCNYFIIEFSFYSANKSIMTIYYWDDFSKLDTGIFLMTNWNNTNPVFEIIERVKSSPNIKTKHAVIEEEKTFSLLKLLDEACKCLKYECYFAFSCITRNFLLEISTLYGIKLEAPWDSKNIDFKNNFNAITKRGIFEKEDIKLWNLIIETCDKIVHYKKKVATNDIKLFCRGISSLFDVLVKYENWRRK